MPNLEKKLSADDVFDQTLATTDTSTPSMDSGKFVLPTELPNNIEDKTLIPRLADTPDKQLIEYRVRVAAQKIGVDPDIAAAIAKQESNFNPKAVSSTGVKGTMQVTNSTATSLGFDRNDPDENILAGVSLLKKGFDRHPDNLEKAIAIYPAPKDRSHYIPSVINYAQQSKDLAAKSADDVFDQNLRDAGIEVPNTQNVTTPDLSSPPPAQEQPDKVSSASLSDLITGHRPQISESQAGAGATLAASKSFLDALGVGFVERQLGKSKTLRNASESLNNFLLGEDKTFEQRAQEDQAKTLAAQEEHPIASGAGTVAGILAPIGAANLATRGVMGAAKLVPGVARAAASAPKIAALVKVLTEGATQGGTYEAVTNPNASAESVGKAASVGAATNAVVAPVLAGAKALTKGFGNALVNFATKTGKPEVAEYITKFIGPSLNKVSLAEKNQTVLNATEDALQTHLKTLDSAGVAGPDMRQVAQDETILKHIESLDNVNERAQATKLLDRLAKYEKRGQVSFEEANQLKRDLYKQANFNTKSDKYNLAAFQKQIALKLKGAIETASGSSKVRALNSKLQNGIELSDALHASTSPNRLRIYMEAVSALTHPITIPAIAAERFFTSVPGSTLTGGATSKISSGLNSVSPQIKELLNTLVPQATKKIDKQRK